MELIVTNAFSINMLVGHTNISFTHITNQTAVKIFNGSQGYTWAVGHADTSAILAGALGATEVNPERVNVLFDGTVPLLVGQYRGPRLPEGTTTLPQGATIEWWLVEYLPPSHL